LSGRPGACSAARSITFLSTQFDVTAIATADVSAPGIDSKSGPPLPTPVAASAKSLGALNISTAGAIGGMASAVSTAHFAGTRTMTALEPLLYVAFDSTTFASASGRGSTSLFISLSQSATTLFVDFVTGAFAYNLFSGITYLLDLTLTSDASGIPRARLRRHQQPRPTTFTSVVPLPAPWLLLLAGLGPVIARKRAARAA